MGILRDLSPLVEQVSVDEAFVDLTGAYRHGQDPVQLAQRARERIAGELSLPSSAGVAPNKLLAKMASTGSKPNGLWVVPPGRVQEFLDPRPVSALWGVGSKSTKLLAGYGIQTIAQLRSLSIEWLRDRFGTSHGEYLWTVARGIDDRPVLTERDEKSMGGEHTFSEDTADAAAISGVVRELSLKLGRRLRESGRLAGRLSLKIRYAGFETHTRSVPLSSPLDSGMRIAELALEALRADGILTGDEAPRPIRLIGVRAEKLARAEDGVQQALFESIEYKPAGRGSRNRGSGGAVNLGDLNSRSSKLAPEATEAVLVKAGRWSEVEHVMDAIQRKYSAESIKPASGVALPVRKTDDRSGGAEAGSAEEARDG
jgi:DNA polymerase IV